jgi:hypothetical protein
MDGVLTPRAADDPKLRECKVFHLQKHMVRSVELVFEPWIPL